MNKHSADGAPLLSALRALAAQERHRFHMPGHKGQPLPFGLSKDICTLDYTEIPDTGNLYDEEGPIRDAERRAAALFHAPDALFLTGGSSQGVHAMLAAAISAHGKPDGACVLLDRNSHRAAMHASVLLGLSPRYIAPCVIPGSAVTGGIDPADLARALQAVPKPACVLITSPTYYGVRQDIPALAAVCRRAGVPLLVDAAHAAHFPALGLPSPIEEGADLAVLSMHKTTSALGQGALLLTGGGFPALRGLTALFGTSSPSYAVMASMDAARADMEGAGREAFRESAAFADALRREFSARKGLHLLDGCDVHAFFSQGIDPCRLTVRTPGLDGHTAARMLSHEYAIDCEMADRRGLVLILTGADAAPARDALHTALRALAARCTPAAQERDSHFAVHIPQTARSPRAAYFSVKKQLPLREAEGHISAGVVTVYPPGVTILAPGEVADKKSIEILYENGYNEDSRIEICV